MPRIELTELERKKLSEAAALSYQTPLSWRDIETIPRDETLVLLHKHGHIFIGHYWKKYDACYGIYHGGPPLCYPTHWQPLPQPPKDEPK
jgi:hypothetical protein